MFTRHLRAVAPGEPIACSGETLRDALDDALSRHEQLRGYVLSAQTAGKNRFRVIAINYQESYATFKKAHEALEEFQLTFSYDRNGKVTRMFGINAIPHMYMLNKRGEIARIHVGYGEESLGVLVKELNELLLEP